MSTTSVSLNVPVSGPGTAADTSGLDRVKSVVVSGDFVGTVNIEISNGSDWCQVKTINRAAYFPLVVACTQMRLNVVSIESGSIDFAAVIAESNTVTAVALTVPPPNPAGGEAVGAAVDVSALGGFITATVDGQFDGSLMLELSSDNVTFATFLGFGEPGCKSIIAPCQFLRVRRRSAVNDVATPTCELGITNLTTAAASGRDTLHVNRSTDQALPATANVLFDNILEQSNIDYDPLTGLATLLQGAVYLCISSLQSADMTGEVLNYQWRDTLATFYGNEALNQEDNRNVNASDQTTAVSIIAPVAGDLDVSVEANTGAGVSTQILANESFALIIRIA